MQDNGQLGSLFQHAFCTSNSGTAAADSESPVGFASLPVEILVRIFQDVIRASAPHTKHADGPYTNPYTWIPVLTFVCKYWRTVVLQSPALWTTVSFVYSKIPTSETVTTLLERSCGLPLVVHAITDGWEDREIPVLECMHVVFREWPRVRELRVAARMVCNEMLVSTYPWVAARDGETKHPDAFPGSRPILEVLDVEDYGDFPCDVVAARPHFFEQPLPDLKSLSWTSWRFRMSLLDDLVCPNLRRLQVNNPIAPPTWEEWAAFLANVPLLEELELGLAVEPVSRLDVDEGGLEEQRVTPPWAAHTSQTRAKTALSSLSSLKLAVDECGPDTLPGEAALLFHLSLPPAAKIRLDSQYPTSEPYACTLIDAVEARLVSSGIGSIWDGNRHAGTTTPFVHISCEDRAFAMSVWNAAPRAELCCARRPIEPPDLAVCFDVRAHRGILGASFLHERAAAMLREVYPLRKLHVLPVASEDCCADPSGLGDVHTHECHTHECPCAERVAHISLRETEGVTMLLVTGTKVKDMVSRLLTRPG